MSREIAWAGTVLIVLVVVSMVSTPALGSVPFPTSEASTVHQVGPTPESPTGASSVRVPSGSSFDAQSVTECTTIDTPGQYVLTDTIIEDAPPEDQPTCIRITASDVVLDGEGHEVRGNVSTNESENSVTGGVAILATDVSNITIRDVRLRSWKHGVRFESVTDGTIRITGSDYAGVSAVDSANVTVHDSRLSGGSTVVLLFLLDFNFNRVESA